MSRSLSTTAVAALLLAATADAQEAKPAAKERATVAVAALGAATRAPTKQEIEALGLIVEVRVRGQVVSELTEGGAAVSAGIASGDVLVELDGMGVFSQDDVADFLRVSRPGQKVEAVVVRAETGKQETISIALGAKQVAVAKEPVLEWQFASLAQLPVALAKAKKQDRLVLVGLSGAET